MPEIWIKMSIIYQCGDETDGYEIVENLTIFSYNVYFFKSGFFVIEN